MWRPRDRHDLVQWIGEFATLIACTLLRHPISREDRWVSSRDRQWLVICHCTRRQEGGMRNA